jgi:Asp-tRNA(Asn)/Glu-tRNA(Gln) amidotransferase A subunit family amidase
VAARRFAIGHLFGQTTTLMSQTSDPTRRQLLAAAAVSAIPTAVSAQQTTTSPRGGAAQPTTRTTTRAEAGFEAADIDAAGRVIGRSYAETERQMMQAGLARTRDQVLRLRALELAPGLEYAVHFDPVLPGRSLPQGESRFQPPRIEVEYDGDVSSLAFATVAQLSALLQAGKVTSVELTRMYLDRLKRHSAELYNVVTLTEELAMQQATRADAETKAGRSRGPLHGIPYGAKDLLATKGIPTTYGVAAYRGQVFDQDATIIKRLEDAGCVLVCKTSLGELAMGDVWFGGTSRNPWDPEKGSSGSSAGSCSATAAGLIPFGIGSETLGSIISPCVVCGTCGLRPTFGRVPRTGALPLTRTMDKLGVIARSVDDLAFVLSAIAGPDGEDPTCHEAPFVWTGNDTSGIRVGYDKTAFDTIERMNNEAVKKLYLDALATCRGLFGELKAIELPRDRLMTPTAMSTIEVEGAESFTDLVEGGEMPKLVQQDDWNWPNSFRRAGLFPAVDYLRYQRLRRRFMEQIDAALGDVDVYVTVPRVGTNLVLTNLTGHPACIQRAGLIEGMPHQIEFNARLYGEGPLLAVASRFEANVPERSAWPRQRWA